MAKKRFQWLRNLFRYGVTNPGRLYSNPRAQRGPANKFLRQTVQELRDRSREAARNDPYAARYLDEITSNIVGGGMTLVSKVPQKQSANKLDSKACKKIEAAWRKFSKRGNFDVTGQFSRQEFERLAIRSVARDGGYLIRLVEGFDGNGFGFAVQGIEIDALPVKYNDPSKRIRMGIKYDEWGKPVSYFIKTLGDTDDPMHGDYGLTGAENYDEIPAASILHLFRTERAGQSAGEPWLASCLGRLQMLRGFEEASLVSARISASAPTYFIKSEDAGPYTGATNPDGTLDVPAEPGTANILPTGYDVKQPAPAQPNPNDETFRRGMLRGIASGGGVSYATLSSDLSNVNYSSIRSGTIAERDLFTIAQEWFITEECRPIFEAWLPMAILSGQLDLPIADVERYKEAEFSGRSWAWVDPLRDISAAKLAVELGVESRQEIARKKGQSFDKLTEENKDDVAMMEEAGLQTDNATLTDEQTAELLGEE